MIAARYNGCWNLDYPIVLFTQEAADNKTLINTVTHDNKKIIADAVEFLMANGHKELHISAEPQNDYSSGAQRLKAF